MREPGPRADASGAGLGELRKVGTAPAAERKSGPPEAANAVAPAPIRVARERGSKPFPLRGRDLVLEGGLTVHALPRGTTARSVEEQGSGASVIELVDSRGRRLALIKSVRVSQVGVSSPGSLRRATAEAHEQAQRDDWGGGRVRVVVDRFRRDTRLFTLERRASGTDFIASGLEFASEGGD